MFFTKDQRNVLGKLSVTVWGSESRWKKLYDNGVLDVLEKEQEVDEEVDKIQVNNSKKGRGTVYNKNTAIDKGLWKDVPETMKVKKVDRRKPSFEELLNSLTDIARVTLYSYLKPEQLINVFAVDFCSGENTKLNLSKKEDEEYAKDLESLLNTLPEEVRQKLNALTDGVPVDAVEFVSEVIFVRTHKDAALELYNQNLEEARKAHSGQQRKNYAKKVLGL